jgi:hypothetical protein
LVIVHYWYALSTSSSIYTTLLSLLVTLAKHAV